MAVDAGGGQATCARTILESPGKNGGINVLSGRRRCGLYQITRNHMIKYAMGWREIQMKKRNAMKLDFSSHLFGVMLMGIFGAFTAVLFFLAISAR